MTTWEGRSGLKPHVLRSGELIAAQFLVPRVLGIGLRDGPSDHPRGLALDFMVGTETGNRIKDHLTHPDNWKLHNVKYVIWSRRIWNRPVQAGYMGEPYSGANPHTDHVHVSYTDGGTVPDGRGTDIHSGGFNPVEPLVQLYESVKNIVDFLTSLSRVYNFLTDPRNWWRIALFALGLIATIVGLIKADMPGSQQVQNTAQLVTKAVRK